MKIKEGGVMDIQKEREAFQKEMLDSKYVAGNISAFWDEETQNYDIAITELRMAWHAWQAAKAQAVPGKTVQLHLVWNENKDECVGFLDQGDAHYTATGNDGGAWGVTALGDYFRDLNDESDEFETQIVMIEAQEPSND